MIFLILLSLILLVCFFIVAFLVNVAMFKPDKNIKRPADGCEVTFRSGKNRLAGYLWNETGTRGLIVFAHGMGVGVGYYLPEIHYFADQGYKVFAFEYSGYTGSTGHFYGFPQAVLDLKNALDFIDDGSLPVVLAGHSMGAYAVCAVGQCAAVKRVDKVVAYAPFFSPREAVIAETDGKMPIGGKILRALIFLTQRILFGKSRNLTAAAGLSRVDMPALVLQGSEDTEVTPSGCALYAYRNELSDYPVKFTLIYDEGSNGHMTVVRKKGSRTVNEDTIRLVDDFLDKIPRR